jgi:hypothetical protein
LSNIDEIVVVARPFRTVRARTLVAVLEGGYVSLVSEMYSSFATISLVLGWTGRLVQLALNYCQDPIIFALHVVEKILTVTRIEILEWVGEKSRRLGDSVEPSSEPVIGVFDEDRQGRLSNNDILESIENSGNAPVSITLLGQV